MITHFNELEETDEQVPTFLCSVCALSSIFSYYLKKI